ncbi:MAG: ABC transporter ATP-binding protein [Chloroflexi bacterium]|nr:MAG: ABC transporter ATP-binding protein [Chloroflexota bacterium]
MIEVETSEEVADAALSRQASMLDGGRSEEMYANPLTADDVSKQFGGGPDFGRLLPWKRSENGHKGPVQVLQGVSFEIRRGEIFGLIGANGSGKSTLIRIFSTLLLPDGGEVRIFGYDAVDESSEVRALINRVSADPSFFRNMSTLENLLFFGRVYGLSPTEIKRRVPVILGRLGFEVEKAREPMSHLSRGQQQKIAVARSFLTSPVLMLLDEPTTGLDPRSKRDVQAFIRQVQAEHDATILLTTHDMQEAELLCDRISFIAGGRIVAEGTPLELRERVARGRSLDAITMETVFMELTGKSIEEDEEREEVMVHG